MTIPDVNVLLHAYDSSSGRHTIARQWWENTLSDTAPVGLSWHAILGFIRIATNPRVWSNPMRVGEAIHHVRLWVAAPCAEIIGPGARHAEILFGLLEAAGAGGNLTSDAHLAALAIEYKGAVATTDMDFALFPGVKWFNPTRH